jgi:hypothetical protein
MIWPRPVEGGFLPILRRVPGFLEYVLVETGEGVDSISVFTERTRAAESTHRAANWVRLNPAGLFTGPTPVTSRSVGLHNAGGATDGTPAW